MRFFQAECTKVYSQAYWFYQLWKSHDIVILSFSNIVKGQVLYREIWVELYRYVYLLLGALHMTQNVLWWIHTDWTLNTAQSWRLAYFYDLYFKYFQWLADDNWTKCHNLVTECCKCKYIVAMQFLMCKMMTSFVSSGLTKATLKMHRNA